MPDAGQAGQQGDAAGQQHTRARAGQVPHAGQFAGESLEDSEFLAAAVQAVPGPGLFNASE